MLKAEIGWRVLRLYHTGKGITLVEIAKCCCNEHMHDGNRNSLIATMEEVSVVWIEDEIRHSVSFSKPNPWQSLNVLNSMKSERGIEAAGKKKNN